MTYTYNWPRPAVAADCVVFSDDNGITKVLLIRRGAEPFKGMWALPGGHLDENESAEQAISREMEEETNLTGLNFEQLHTYSRFGRDPRGWVVSVVFTSHIALEEAIYAKAGDDAIQLEWFDINDLPDLAFDHNEAIELAIGRKT